MKKLIITILFAVSAQAAGGVQFEELTKLDRNNNAVKSIRNGINQSIIAVKSRKSPDSLPELKFYAYTCRANDTFWEILSVTALDMDTVVTVNSLNTPKDIKPGRTIYLPNMRGVLYKTGKRDSINDIANRFEVNAEYILHTNKMSGLSKKNIFIPCGRISQADRSFFLGTAFATPVNDKSARVSSGFGQRIDPIIKRLAFHAGIDIACNLGTPVKAARDGVVAYTGIKGEYGMLVIIKHERGFDSYYGHLGKIFVKPGQTISARQIIALSGNTGRTTGPHLHFEVRKNNKVVNPRYLVN